jgi:hypothetical protein
MLDRNHQVRLMRNIYARAESTVVWLGPSDETTHIAYQKILCLFQDTLAEIGAQGDENTMVVTDRLTNMLKEDFSRE